MKAEARSRLSRAAPWLAIVAASFAFRLPSLLNGNMTNSDAAVCGLQALHILRGEWSWFLWGSGYQTSIDSLVAAGFFLVFGASGVALMLSTLTGHVALTLFAFATLKRHLKPWVAVALVSLLVFTAGPIHTYVLYPPRQASLTIVFASIFFLDRASRAKRPRLSLAIGALLAGLASFADPYALLFLPVLALLALLASFDDDARTTLRDRWLTLGLAFALGVVPYLLLRSSRGASHGQTSLSLAVVKHNWDLLWDSCLGWVLSTKVYAAKGLSDYQPWEAPRAFVPIQIAGAVIVVAMIASGAFFFFDRKIAWPLRRLGLVGAVMLPLNVAAFLVSPMVMDHFSSRYLVGFLLTAPFAIAPLASRMKPLQLTALAPYLLSSAVAGWVAYRPFVDGFAIDTRPGRVEDEKKVIALLRDKGIHFAVADYWASYRLGLLAREDPFVVPKNPAEDRYPKYRAVWEATPWTAYIYDADRSRESFDDFEAAVWQEKTPFRSEHERIDVGRFKVLLLRRR